MTLVTFGTFEMATITQVLIALLFFAIYSFVLAVYRLYFSPLAHFPGPKIAALSLWYEFYWDVIKRGRYTFKIQELHQRYGHQSHLLTSFNLDADFLWRSYCSHQSIRAPYR